MKIHSYFLYKTDKIEWESTYILELSNYPKEIGRVFEIYDKNTIYLDRVFGRVYQNSVRGDDAILLQFQEKINISVDFLFKPNYYEYSTEEDMWIVDNMEDGPSKELYLQTIKKGQIESEKSWVKIDWFLKELKRFREDLNNSNNYYLHLSGWGSYFKEKQFEADIDKLYEILTELRDANVKEFTFDIF